MFHLVRPILSQLFYTTASMLRVLGNLRVSCITEPSKSFLCDATDEKYTSAIIWRSLARLASVFSKWALPVSQQLYSATLRSAQTKGQAQCTRERMGHTLSTLQSSLTLVHVLTNKPGTQHLVKLAPGRITGATGLPCEKKGFRELYGADPGAHCLLAFWREHPEVYERHHYSLGASCFSLNEKE